MRWSKLKKSLDDLRAPALDARVALHQARYRYTREEVGRIWVTVDGREVASFDSSRDRAGRYDDSAALLDLEAYLSLPIDEALRSPSPLVRAMAVVDRRVGKRRLRALDVGPREHPLVRELYLLRCEAEGLHLNTPTHL